jgi:hypothetical protein
MIRKWIVLLDPRTQFSATFYTNNTLTGLSGGARFEVFTAKKIQAVVFWFVMPCSDVGEYQRFGDPCRLHLQVKMEVAWISKMMISCEGPVDVISDFY